MTKFCARNVRMNKPTTRTEQMLAAASKDVSSRLCCGSASVLGGVVVDGVFFVVILSLGAQMAGGKSDKAVAALVDDAEDSFPPGKGREASREFPVVSEFIIRDLWHVRSGGTPH